MDKTVDLMKFKKLQHVYLRQPYAEGNDLEIISRWAEGESVIALTHEFHRSKSALYRLRDRVISFLDNTSEDPIYARLLSDLWVDIPTPLLYSSIGCDDEEAFTLLRMSVGLYLAGSEHFFPKWFLAEFSPALGREDCAVRTMRNMYGLLAAGIFHWFRIYETLKYEDGIWFRFSKETEGILDEYPAELMLRTIKGTDSKEIS